MLTPAFDLDEFLIADGLEFRFADAGEPNHIFIAHDERRAAIDHSAHRQFGLLRHANLAHQHEVERGLKHGRHFRRHRNATPRQRENHDRLAFVAGKRLGKFLAGLLSIFESHAPLHRG